jgi:hypothetical protein
VVVSVESGELGAGKVPVHLHERAEALLDVAEQDEVEVSVASLVERPRAVDGDVVQ